MRPHPELSRRILAKAQEAEDELKRLGRWQTKPLPPEKFENIGAFGSNTMGFEQWIQFILIPRIQSAISTSAELPDESMLAPYAVRYFDGDPEGGGNLHQILYDIDELINNGSSAEELNNIELSQTQDTPAIYLNDETIPDVIYTLADLLPQYEGDPLESQLQTFDTFLSVLSPKTRPMIADLLKGAAVKTANEVSRKRIEQAAESIANGGRAAEPYNHEEAMKNYIDNFKKSYPDNTQAEPENR